jgi:N-acetylglucosaminyldiphosphoundecaprenol N-acetyl-beta-D-mannosaminyltransferase
LTGLGVRLDAIEIPAVIDQMEDWIRAGESCHSICLANAFALTQAQQDAEFREALNSADLSVADGMSLVWLSRLKGRGIERRVYGPDLLLEFCERTQTRRYRHFFYGGAPGTPERLVEELRRRYPMLQVAGTLAPPFRPLTPEEEDETIALINRITPDVIWVGLGAPKQELWMRRHQSILEARVLVGVGAAFDFLSGRVRQAPPWMREHGLEWLFRLWQEPRRLWRRYLVGNVQFVGYLALEALGFRHRD